ncbi:DHA2 family efflux MFS transporter permease subunit [Cellulomonas iranensis]|uniref:MFS transporter n=1 Tax=Cellulomonas iranensis TaxID=76862 RepID=UPI001CF1BCC5|nr:MFS transporter [Cellulomonas iranensis]UCN16370.1 DHA2 family efflux MFS transporter permease subunit [Cellulomonas iranensis]
MPTPAPNAPSRRWWILATVSLTQLLVVLDGTIVNVALPRAQADLGLSDTSRQWVITAYALAFGALLLLGGRIADFWGRRRTFVLGLVLFGAGSAWGGLAHSAGELLIARGSQGVAAALMAPAALAIMTVTFPSGRERNSAFAIFGSVAGAGSAVGLLLGGVLTEYLSWRWCLLVNVPFVVLGVVGAVTLLTESRAEGDRRYDLLGTLTVTAGLGSLVYGLTLAEESWTSVGTLGLLALGAALLTLFVVVEARSSHPLLPLHVVRDRARAAAFLLQALTGAVMIGAMLYLTFHLQIVLGLSPLLAGLATLPITVGIMVTVPFATTLLNRIGPRRQLVFGPLIAAAGVAYLGFITVDGGYWSHVFPGVLVMGVGMGFTFVPLQNLSLLGVASHDSGAAAATANASNQIGGSIGLAVVTAVYVAVVEAAADPSSPAAAVEGYTAVFLLAAGLLVVAAGLAAALVGKDTMRGAARADLAPVPHLG